MNFPSSLGVLLCKPRPDIDTLLCSIGLECVKIDFDTFYYRNSFNLILEKAAAASADMDNSSKKKKKKKKNKAAVGPVSQQATIIKTSDNMVTIRSPQLQRALDMHAVSVSSNHDIK